MAADERANITIDVDVKNLARLQELSAALEEVGLASELNAEKFEGLTGAMGRLTGAQKGSSQSSKKLYEQVTLLDKVTGAFAKQARKMMFGVIAMSVEFAASAVALASVNAAFVIGKLAVKGYHLVMQGLSGALAAVGAAAVAAAAAFSEFQTAQFAFRYQSDNVTSSLDKSSIAMRSLYKDTQLNIFGFKALSAAFAAVSKNTKFTGESQKMLQAFADFAASSGDPTKGLQAAANAVGLIQKKQVGIYKNSKYMSQEAINAIKQINPALADLYKTGAGTTGAMGNKEKFIEMLMSGELAEKAGVSGAAQNLAGTLFAQFKSYVAQAFVELSDVGKRVLNPVKEALHDIFLGLTKTFRRVSSDLVSFGQGPFLATLVKAVNKLEDFAVTLFRKYLPTTQGFFSHVGRIFQQLKTWFHDVTTSLSEMRAGGSVVIRTFGGPILEIFKQIGNNARSLAETATKNREKFAGFADSLKDVVKGFFGMSAAFRQMFTQALPLISIVLKGVAKIFNIIESIFNRMAGLGQFGSMIGVLAGAFAIKKGTRYARRQSRGGKGSGPYGYTSISAEEAAAQGLSITKFGGAGGTGSIGNPMSGAMAAAANQISTTMTTGLTPGINAVASSATTAAQALSGLAAAGAAATGGTLRNGMMGGSVDTSGRITSLPSRKPGQTTKQYREDIAGWMRNQAGGSANYYQYMKSQSGGLLTKQQYLRQVYGTVPVDTTPLEQRGRTQASLNSTQEIDRHAYLLQVKQKKEAGRLRAIEMAKTRPERQTAADLAAGKISQYTSVFNSREALESAAQFQMSPEQAAMSEERLAGGFGRRQYLEDQKATRQIAALKSGLRKIKSFPTSFTNFKTGGYANFKEGYKKHINKISSALDLFNSQGFGAFTGGGGTAAGITGAMPAGGGGGGGINIAHKQGLPPNARQQMGTPAYLRIKAGRFVFGGGYQGKPIRSEIANWWNNDALGSGYEGSKLAQQNAYFEKYGTLEGFKLNRKGAAKAGLKEAFSGAGVAMGLAGSALASRYGTQEAQGALQTGAGLMSMDKSLGIAVGGLGTALKAKTRLGGVAAGAIGGAAAGQKIASMLGTGPYGQAIGAALGSVIGGAVGFFAASRNQKKMVKEAGKRINSVQLAELAASAVTGAVTGTTKDVRKKMAKASNLAEAFRKAGTKEERLKVLREYSTGPNAVISGNDLSNAAGKNYEDMQKQLDKNVKNQKKLIPLYDTFDKRMKLLQGTTHMTSEEIWDLAMKKNVNLYDSTLKLSDITEKLGVGMIRTGKQMQDAFKDIRIGAMGVFDDFKQSKAMKDAIQAAGQTLLTGAGTPEEFADYFNKFGDLLDYTNPNSPLGNIVSQVKAFGVGSQFGQGLQFTSTDKNVGVLSGTKLTADATKLGGEYTQQMVDQSSALVSSQITSQLLGSNIAGVDPDAIKNILESRTKSLLTTVNAGNVGGATAEQKTAAAKAEQQLKYIENAITNPAAFAGLSSTEATKKLNDLFGPGTFGGKGALSLQDIGKQIEVKLDEEGIQQQFLDAVKAGFSDMNAMPEWWNQAPTWWSYKFNPETGKFEQADTRSPRRNIVGDTSAPKALGRTMAAHHSMDSMLTGKRNVTSSFRTTGLGSPSSDHAAGRAYDLTGQNLGQYASLAKSAGGFAEFHGAASSRHLHVVPALGRMGDTASPQAVGLAAMQPSYSGGDISITIVESKDARATAREVAKEIIAIQKNERRRM